MGCVTHRLVLLGGVALAAVVILATPHCAFGQEPGNMKTYTYKKVGDLEIKADVYPASGEAPRPVVLWIHGGALIIGHRGQTDRTLFNQLHKAGYALVSIDYRLAPETKLPGILEDLRDAYKWVHDEGPRLFHADPNRIAVMGGSAGGYLTLVSGYLVEPKPRVLVSFWGYGDIAGDWYSKPDPFYSQQPAVPKEEAYQAVGGSVPTGTPGPNNRGRFYLYCRQNGLWPREVSGLDPEKDPKAFDAFCPARRVTSTYPPTFLIHGTKDTDVPYALSVMMDRELTSKGVEHKFITIKDGPHGLRGVDPAVVADMYERVLAFVNKHMGVPAGK
jgi:acetyl esterase/lipase